MIRDQTNTTQRIVAGCMTGTSLDGLDVALVRIIGHGLDMTAELIGHHAVPLPSDLRATLMHLASGHAAEPIVYLRAARQLGMFHAQGLRELFAQHPDAKPDFVTAHGQTIWHAPRPRKDEPADLGPMSWQLFDPWPIVQDLGLPVCYDLRQADLIAGGEGAPLTPIADWVMYRGKASIVYNLGGVGNFTWLAHGFDKLHGGDIDGCNLILDGVCQRLFGKPYDEDGAFAARGRTYPEISGPIGQALRLDVWSGSGGPVSLGREQFSPAWLDHFVETIRPLGPGEDLLRQTLWHVANSLCQPIDVLDEGNGPVGHEHVIVLAGGGAKNKTLVHEMTRRMTEEYPAFIRYRYKFVLSDDLGIPCEAREAMGFAVLGALSQDGVPVSLAQVTGAEKPGFAGVWAGLGRE